MASSTIRVVRKGSSAPTATRGPSISSRRPGSIAESASGVLVKITRRERELNRRLRSRLATELSGSLATILGTARQGVDRNRLEALIATNGDPFQIVDPPLESMNEGIRDVMEEAYETAIQDGAALGLRVAGVPGITVDAAGITAAAQNWILSEGATRIAGINAASRDAVSSVVADAISGRLTPNAAARRISDVIGLDARSARAVDNFEARLLRQRIPIPAADTALVRETIAQDVNRFRGRLLQQRARRIASTEMQEAIHEGEQQFWVQAAERGEVKRGEMRKRWFTVQDDRVCPICAPMHGQVRQFDSNFVSPEGFAGRRPPAHVQCRCFMEVSPDGRF